MRQPRTRPAHCSRPQLSSLAEWEASAQSSPAQPETTGVPAMYCIGQNLWAAVDTTIGEPQVSGRRRELGDAGQLVLIVEVRRGRTSKFRGSQPGRRLCGGNPCPLRRWSSGVSAVAVGRSESRTTRREPCSWLQCLSTSTAAQTRSNPDWPASHCPSSVDQRL
jgi:hypothetical protein